MNSGKKSKPNRLIKATSPYLLQHAHNPVDWQEWGSEALNRAKQEDKPILVSIGYSSCHWCHVMERECFEDNDIAALMNEFFICIKVDREERPDIDQVYMEAVQAMGISGGWPLNVFLTPDQKPFFGGTYFPPPQWAQALNAIHKAFQSRRPDINQSAEELTRLLASSGTSTFEKQSDHVFTESLQRIFQNLEKKFDRTHGGLEKAPKFIMPSIWSWLLRYHYHTRNTEALNHVRFTLKKIFYGGIYDQVGGGFARYSVDGEWFVPHFEKMLYDNAQLISVYSEAYQVTRDDEFRQAVYETFRWLQREMTHEQGGFYSALDADSEGKEGKFYVWTHQEVLALSGEAAEQFCAYYNVTPAGNWEHGVNILFRKENIPPPLHLDEYRTTLLHHRNKRIQPGLDRKIVSGWNTMTIGALVDAYHAFSDLHFLKTALKAMNFLETYLITNSTVYRTWNEVRSPVEGFLEDYAYLIQACLKLYEATLDEHWLEKAGRYTEKVFADFYDPADGYFFYSGREAEQLIARKKEMFDNVIPASNSVMAQNLLWLGELFDKEEWRITGRKMIDGLAELIISEPNYMSNWAIGWLAAHTEVAEVAIVGPEYVQFKNELKNQFHPTAVILGTAGESKLPLLQDKDAGAQTTLYVCYNKTCRQPVYSVEEAVSQFPVR